MKVVGIIVEYNPFHNGHQYHLEKTKALSEADIVIAVMSSHAVQRGEFSCVDKFTKTRWALEAGIDLVIELPGVFALQSADLFAKTSVELCDILGVDSIYFGSETGDIKALEDVVAVMRSPRYNELIKGFLDEGKSYPSSSDFALQALSEGDVFTHPNNILGIQYIKAIETLDSSITPYAIKRIETGYYDDIKAGTTIQSATAIRKMMLCGEDVQAFVPSYVNDDLKRSHRVDLKHWFPYMTYKLASSTAKELNRIFGFEEGLEHLFMKYDDASSFDDFMGRVVSARYTHAKIKRALMHMLIGIKKDDLEDFSVPYVRVLGMSKTGQGYLNQIKHDLPVPLITKLKQARHPYLDIELRITKVYDLILNQNLFKQEFRPVIIR